MWVSTFRKRAWQEASGLLYSLWGCWARFLVTCLGSGFPLLETPHGGRTEKGKCNSLLLAPLEILKPQGQTRARWSSRTGPAEKTLGTLRGAAFLLLFSLTPPNMHACPRPPGKLGWGGWTSFSVSRWVFGAGALPEIRCVRITRQFWWPMLRAPGSQVQRSTEWLLRA